ncbi:3'-N-debenzoyl-2'-deoxytaxol N-benzoyltransferase-like [Lolium rigidum]|uniref:3'-N-debenzoyl-2'-deoxytaxol N-benzoyltransferase-like n=1 Tax=Lolium rigidum TaxID=89674 RepID=UPI001F5E0BA6|nr:3'-N-debenzoyl-2'-deoxytaxol N-benzoyltransferase-like [Lolium rigidum]
MEPPPPQQQEQQLLRVLDSVKLSPAKQPPASSLPLSGLDADRNMLDVSFRTVRFFPPHPVSLDPLDALQDAFAAALALFPQLAGSLRDDDGRLVFSGAGDDAVTLVLAASELSAADVDADAPDSPLLDRLAPRDGEGGPAALALQATRFACGGVALGMRVAHALCDGAGSTKFLAAAARLARGQEPAVAPVWERQELLGPRNPPRVVTPFDAVLATDEDVARRGPYGHEQDPLARVCFHVSDARVETLRARLAADAGVKLTTFEVLAAFIWRARVKANRTAPDETVKMVYSMNIGGLLDPPLPEGYWGNVCVPVYVALAAGDLVGQPLAETVSLVKKSKRGVDEEYVRSYIDFLELHRGEGVTAGRRGVSAFTDWRRLGHSEVDFGWGGPDAVLPLSWRLLGSVEPCFLLPYGATDERRRRGFKVFVAVREETVPRFKEEMEEILLQPERSDCISVGKL